MGIVIVRRKYKESQITHTVKHESGTISIEMDLDEFMGLIVQEAKITSIGFINRWITKKFMVGVDPVIKNMKESSIHHG